MPQDYRARMTIELRPDQHRDLTNILPHGAKKHLFQAVVDGILDLHSKGGYDAIAPIISGHITISQLSSVSSSRNISEGISKLEEQLAKLRGML